MTWLKTLLAKWYVKGIVNGELRTWLQGRKTQVLLILGIIAAVYQWKTGTPIPEWVCLIWGSVTGITYKAGMNRTEAKVKELLEALQQDKVI